MKTGTSFLLETITFYVWHTGSPVRYYRSLSNLQVSAGISSVTASPNPFIPTGTNAAEITVEAEPGQAGLKLYFGRIRYWRTAMAAVTLPLTETATPASTPPPGTLLLLLGLTLRYASMTPTPSPSTIRQTTNRRQQDRSSSQAYLQFPVHQLLLLPEEATL